MTIEVCYFTSIWYLFGWSRKSIILNHFYKL